MTPRKPKALTRRERMGGGPTRTATTPPIRLTPEEEATLERAAVRAGLPLATWIRRAALDAARAAAER